VGGSYSDAARNGHREGVKKPPLWRLPYQRVRAHRHRDTRLAHAAAAC
jgi:hypothetical protein